MKAIMIHTKQKTMKISLAEVCAISTHPSKPHHLHLFAEDHIYDFPGRLSELEERYPNDLIRCHRSTLINPVKIKEINQTEKSLILGDKRQYHFPYSRRCYRDVMEKWLERGEQ